jgi:hypothetical protein
MKKRIDDEPEEEDFQARWSEYIGRSGAQCPSPELLLAASGEDLPDDLKRSITIHVAGCPLCRVLARDLGEIAQPTPEEQSRIRHRVFQDRITSAVRPPAPLWWLLRPAAALAFLIVAVIGGALLLRQTRQVPSNVNLAVLPSSQPSLQLPLEKAPIRVNASSALLWRGNGDSSQKDYLTDLGSALAPYREDNFPEAIRRLENVVQKFPDAEESRFYLGVSFLLSGRYNEAIGHLQQVQQMAAPLQPEAEWYLSVAYGRAGQRESALTWLRKLCQVTGEHQVQACKAIRLEPSPR